MHRVSSIRRRQQVDAGMVVADAEANRANGVVPRIFGSVATGSDLADEQRTVRQLHRLAVAVGVVDEKAVVVPSDSLTLESPLRR